MGKRSKVFTAQDAQAEMAKAAVEEGDKSQLLVDRACDITPVRLRWVWPSWVPKGKITLEAGKPEIGKSTLLLDLAARLTRRAPMPDGSRGDPDDRCDVLIFSAEDTANDTIVPRLIAANARMEHVYLERTVIDKNGMAKGFNLRDDLVALERKVRELRPILVIFDPLSAYVGRIDAHRETEVRQLLRPFGALAAEYDFAVIAIVHVNKAKDFSALMRILGSVAFGATARSVIGVVPDPDVERQYVAGVIKTNLAVKPPALAYQIEAITLAEKVVDWGDPEEGVWPEYEPLLEEISTTRLAWRGERTGVNVEEVMSQELEPAARVAQAETFLKEELKAGAVPQTQVETHGKAAGLSMITLNRAKKHLGVTSLKVRRGDKDLWVWALSRGN